METCIKVCQDDVIMTNERSFLGCTCWSSKKFSKYFGLLITAMMLSCACSFLIVRRFSCGVLETSLVDVDETEEVVFEVENDSSDVSNR